MDAVNYVAGVDVDYGEDNVELTAAVVILEAETKPTASPEPRTLGHNPRPPTAANLTELSDLISSKCPYLNF